MTRLEESQMLVGLAEETRNWKVLINRRDLMTAWMARHKTSPDFMEIARVGSHRSGSHRLCGDKCEQIGIDISIWEKLYPAEFSSEYVDNSELEEIWKEYYAPVFDAKPTENSAETVSDSITSEMIQSLDQQYDQFVDSNKMDGEAPDVGKMIDPVTNNPVKAADDYSDNPAGPLPF